jgi:outer membrane protein with beta-barrel domain
MQRPWIAIVLAAALSVSAGGAIAAAQTVTVINAPPNAAVDVVLNAATVASSTADAAGAATLPAKMKDAIGKIEIDANVFVDFCENRRRVLIVEVGAPSAPIDAGCDRRQISGLYWVRPVNTVVVNLAGVAPTLLLIKGSYGIPAPGADGTTSTTETHVRSWTRTPNGLVLSGSAGLAKYRDALTRACGNVTPCSGNDSGLAYSAGAAYWITRFLGVEGTYLKPKTMKAAGGDIFTFNSTLDPDVWTVAGLVGAPVGPVRLFGKGGMDYHQATSTTVETINGASQTLAFRTKGFGWLFGGGGEVWLTSHVALFGEFDFVRLKGDAEGGGEPVMDDRLRVVVGGLRVHLGR